MSRFRSPSSTLQRRGAAFDFRSSAVSDPNVTIGDLGEREVIQRIAARIPAGPGVTLGVGDDAAAVETGPLTLVTTDCLVEGVHFRRDWSPPRLVGRKALSVNLSDIAAMAGIPRFATVSLCLPPDLNIAFVEDLYDGLLEKAAEAGVHIVGGNLSSTTSQVVVDVTLLGQGDRLLRRSGAKPGDLAVVTGKLGAAAVGLTLLRQGARLTEDGYLFSTGLWTESSAEPVVHCLRAALDPGPPLVLARSLAEHDIVHAAIDISDGLSGDLLAMCQASGLSATIDPSAVPIDEHASRLLRTQGCDDLEVALHGGEDYQLLFALPADRLEKLNDLAIVWDVPLSIVGHFAEGTPGLMIETDVEAVPLEPRSWDHYLSRQGAKRPLESADGTDTTREIEAPD